MGQGWASAPGIGPTHPHPTPTVTNTTAVCPTRLKTTPPWCSRSGCVERLTEGALEVEVVCRRVRCDRRGKGGAPPSPLGEVYPLDT